MARRKITEQPEAAELVDLPELTAKQQAFVEALLSGKSATDAYRVAYDCTNWTAAAIAVEACRLKSHPKVSLWMQEARKAGLGSATVTLENHLRELERLKELGIERGNIGAAVQAEQLRGKASGHYVEQTVDLTAANDPERILLEIAQLSPEYAEALAKQQGFTIDKPKH